MGRAPHRRKLARGYIRGLFNQLWWFDSNHLLSEGPTLER